MYFSKVGKNNQLGENVNQTQMKSGSRKEKLSFVKLHKIPSQVAKKMQTPIFNVI